MGSGFFSTDLVSAAAHAQMCSFGLSGNVFRIWHTILQPMLKIFKLYHRCKILMFAFSLSGLRGQTDEFSKGPPGQCKQLIVGNVLYKVECCLK